MRYDHELMLPEKAFRKLGKHLISFEGGKGGDAPAPPDYTGAANATAAGNLEAARVAAKANRVSQYTPYGNLVYTQGTGSPQFNQSAYDQAMRDYNTQSTQSGQNNEGGYWETGIGRGSGPGGMTPVWKQGVNPNNKNTSTVSNIKAPNINDFYTTGDQDRWTATTTLSPAQQAILDQQNKISLGLGSTMDKGLGYVNEMLSNKFDVNRLPAEQINAGQTVQDAIMARLQPQLEREQSRMQTQMANQGIGQGTEAYKNAEEAFRQTQNDRLIQAALQGMQTGQQARQQALQEQAFLRNEPLNTLNAVRTGAQVQNPTFVSPAQQATTQGADLMGAAQQGYNAQLGQYNAQQAGKNNLMGGLFSLGGAAMMSPWAGGALGF